MLLGTLQSLLSDLYDLDVPYDVDDFLTTDAAFAARTDRYGRSIDEKLLIAEGDGEASVSLYIEQRLLERLESNDPIARLTAENLEDFWTAFEGVSHFIYYAWNAGIEKPVTLLEMELQAEVDKFVATALLLQRQDGRQPAELHRWLFDLPRFDERLEGAELDRYRHANRYAGKYCQRLAPVLADSPTGEAVMRELRRFYRLSQTTKIEHIESC